jgi:hypothetical protein
MSKTFRRGDHVEWNSEGRVRGVIIKKVISAVRFKGYVHHASRAEPQYIIKSEKTDHVAIHKGQALKHIKTKKKMKPKKTKARRRTAFKGQSRFSL